MNTQTHTPVIRGVCAPAPVYPVKLDALSRAAVKRMSRARMQRRVEEGMRALRCLGVDRVRMAGGASRFHQGMAAGFVLACSVFAFVLALTGSPT